MTEPEEVRPALRVVKGDPTPEELAALVAVVQARASAGGTRPAPKGHQNDQSGWAAYWRSVRQPVRHGPGGWRASALPK